MKTRFWALLGLLLLLPVILLAGCATDGGYQGSESGYYRAHEPRYYRGYEPEYSSPGEVPPYYYNDNSAYGQWFSAPYWRPDIGP